MAQIANVPTTVTLLLAITGLSGCTADYMSRDEFISPDLGNAMATNTALQTVNPQPAAAYDSQLDHAGAPAATAVTAYSTRPAGPTSADSKTVVAN